MLRFRQTVLTHSVILGIYLAVSLLMTWPLVLQLNSRLAGNPGDNQVYAWTLWLFRYSLLNGSTPFYTTLIFYPQGVSLLFHSPILTMSAPAFFLQSFLSPVATYNIVLIAAMVLMGYGSWLLVRDLTKNSIAAWIASLIFTFSPVYMAHAMAGHMDYVGTEFIPFFLFFFLRAFDSNFRWQDATLAGIFLALVAFSNWGYLLFLFLWLVLHACFRWLTDRRRFLRWHILRQYIIVGAGTAVLISPLVIPMIRFYSSGNYDMTRYIGGAALDVADLFGFITPSIYHPLWGSLTALVSRRFTGNPAENTVFLGFTAIALAIYGVLRIDKSKTRLWIVTAIVFGILALGPGLHILGQFQFTWLAWMQMGSVAQRLGVPMKPEWVASFNSAPLIPLPAILFQILPVFNFFRAASRLTLIVMLALSILAGYGVAALLLRVESRRWFNLPVPALVSVILTILVLFEFCVLPFPTTSAAVPEFYQRVAKEPGQFGIVELPFLPFRAEGQYNQTVHGKSLAYGYLSRVSEDGFAYIDKLKREVEQPTGYFEQVDIRYLILHKSQLVSLNSTEAGSLKTALDTNFELVEDSGDLRVYRAYPLRDSQR